MKSKPTRKKTPVYMLLPKRRSGYYGRSLRGGIKRFNKVYQDKRSRHSLHIDYGGTVSFMGHQPDSAPPFVPTITPDPDYTDIINEIFPPRPITKIVLLKDGQRAWDENGNLIEGLPDPVLIGVEANIDVIQGTAPVTGKVVVNPGVDVFRFPGNVVFFVYTIDGDIIRIGNTLITILLAQ